MLIIHSNGQIEPLQYYKELAVKTRVNGERSLSFILLSTDANYSLVETDNIIEYSGQQYRIIKINERSKGANSVKSVQCLHILFDLIDNDVEDTLNGSQTLNQVMSFILSGTSYTFDIVDSFNSVTLEDWGGDNSLALFQKALNLFGAEFEVNNTHITLKAQIGNTTDFQFRYKYNIKTIEKSVEKVGNDVKMSIKLTFAELKKAGFDYEVVNCGDTIFTIYEPMNINVSNRIIEYTEHPLEPKESNVILANYQDNITDIMADFGDTQKRFNKVVDSNDKVRLNYLDDATQRATTALNNALTELEFPENMGIIARDPNDANRFVVLKSNGLGITTDGGVTFKDAITADGFVLTAGAIGQLKANNIDISGVITAINDEGSTFIDGGKITITTNQDFNNTDSKATDAKNLTDTWVYPNTTEIDGGKITTGTIAADKITTNSLSAISADLGTVTAGTLYSVSISGGTISSDSTINVTTDANIGNFIYLGNGQSSGSVRGIDFNGGNTRIQTNGDGLLFDSLGDFLFARALKTSNSETGFCGIGARHDAATTGSVAGTGVNYRIRKSYTPSSISLSPTSYTASPNITNITSHGFWVWVNGTGVSGGYPYWRGYYTC